jgi:PHP family Zn ribbon phosphoesterase
MTVYVTFNCKKCGRKYQINDIKEYSGLCPICLKHINKNIVICDNQTPLLV